MKKPKLNKIIHAREELHKWYEAHKRHLPWRETDDAYLIWLSEIILQQTRVDQGLPYYKKIAAKFPTVHHLAAAKESALLKLWQGLGYYSRARNMHQTARKIVAEFDGKFPCEFEKLRKLKGIGDYTAAAVSSFAFNKPQAVVDGNVFRFLSRFFGIKFPVDSPQGKKHFQKTATGLLDIENPGLHNQAIMEFGAMQCKPAPDCSICPINSECFAFRNRKVKLLPIKSKSTTVRKRYFNYLFIHWNKKVFLHQRTEKDIWQMLHEFPLIETPKKIPVHQLISTKSWKELFGKSKLQIKGAEKKFVHRLSHQAIHASFIEIRLKSAPQRTLKSKYKVITAGNLKKFVIPRLIERYLLEKPMK